MSRRNFFREYQRQTSGVPSSRPEQSDPRREASRLSRFPFDDDEEEVIRVPRRDIPRPSTEQEYVPARVGHRRYASQNAQGSTAYEEEVTPDDLNAEYAARARYMRESRDAANDYYQARYNEQQLMLRDRQRRDEMELARQRQDLYSNRDFLNYQLELQKERNRQENERRRLEFERERYIREVEEAERRRTALELSRAMQRDTQTRQQKRLGNDDYLSQILEELNLTPSDLRGIRFFNGRCYSRSTLYKHYLTTILFVGFMDVRQDPQSPDQYIIAYSAEGTKRIKYKKDDFACIVHIKHVPNRNIFIADICGVPEEYSSKKKTPVFDLDGNEQEPPKKSLFGRMMGYLW